MESESSSARFSPEQHAQGGGPNNDILKKIQQAQKEAAQRRGADAGVKVPQNGDRNFQPTEQATGSQASSSSAAVQQANPAVAAPVHAGSVVNPCATAVMTSQQHAQLAANIRAAQRQARSVADPTANIKAAQRLAAMRRAQGSNELQRMIYSAQRKGIPAAQEMAMAAPKWTPNSPALAAMAASGSVDVNGAFQPTWAAFIGNWVDIAGNHIRVYSTDAWQPWLVASMARPRGPELQFSLWLSDQGDWICGSNVLDVMNSSLEELRWVTPQGHPIQWIRARE